MTYTFPAPYNNDLLAAHYTQHPSGLSDAEIERVRQIGEALATRPVTLYGGSTDEQVKATGADFLLNDDTRWLYERMGKLAQRINAMHYQFDLTGFENFYYLRYDAELNEHFDWHLDIGPETPSPRKLSMVLQLSDPSEYDGGNFDVLTARDHITVEKQKGIITAFPAYKPHRVTPVTKGVRRTLSMFLVGPQFR